MPYISYSSYPNAIDGYSTLPLLVDTVNEIRADGLGGVNRLRDAIIKIETALGTTPGQTYGPVSQAITSLSDAITVVESQILNLSADAYQVAFQDAYEDFATTTTNVEEALTDLGSIPNKPNVIGEALPYLSNSGIPSFVGGAGTKFVFNTSGSGNEVVRTDPIAITGLHVFEISSDTPNGVDATLVLQAGLLLTWEAPDDDPGPSVDISTLTAGQWVTVKSSTGHSLRVARTSVALPSNGFPIIDVFDVLSLSAADGFSLPSAESSPSGTIQFTDNIIHVSSNINGTGFSQFSIGGIVYPADRGILVLQRKTLSAADFFPIAILNLGATPISTEPCASFNSTKTRIGQLVYSPSLSLYDSITLFDRVPVENYYGALDLPWSANPYLQADGSVLYQDNDNTYFPYQVARYLIPVSHSDLGVGGALTSPTSIDFNNLENDVSAYRIVHFRSGISNWNGEPAQSDIYSISDSFGIGDSGNNTVRFSHVYSDPHTVYPNVSTLNLRPVYADGDAYLSGVCYYGDGYTFDVEVASDANLFVNTYAAKGTLQLGTDVFTLPSGTDINGNVYGTTVDLAWLRDISDGYAFYSAANLPVFTDTAWYLLDSFNSSYAALGLNQFSANAYISAYFTNIYGAGATVNAYGYGGINRILVDSYSSSRSTATVEYFTDESYRVDGALVPWDPTVYLISGQQDLQCGAAFAQSDFCGLIYPQDNYNSSAIAPNQPNLANIDYSGFVGDRQYYRVFSFGYPVSSASLRIVSAGASLVSFDDISFNNPNRFAAVEVMLPASTSWIDITRPYEIKQNFMNAYNILEFWPLNQLVEQEISLFLLLLAESIIQQQPRPMLLPCVLRILDHKLQWLNKK